MTSNSNPPLSANPKALTSRPAKSPHTKGAETTRLIEGRFACSKLTLKNPTVAHAMPRSSSNPSPSFTWVITHVPESAGRRGAY